MTTEPKNVTAIENWLETLSINKMIKGGADPKCMSYTGIRCGKNSLKSSGSNCASQ